MRYLEDFSEGQSFELGEETISEREIVEFARRFDAQPLHVDPDRGLLNCVGELFKQSGERVLLIRWSAMIGRRPDHASAGR